MMTSVFGALGLHLLCGLGLAAASCVANYIYHVTLISHPDITLLVFLVIECPIVILLYSIFRHNPEKCSYLKAVGRGLLGLPAGALVIGLGAIALGAPVGTKYFSRTVSWCHLMSTFTFAPAAAVYGSSFVDWIRIFANTKSTGSIDYMVCLPAHGAILGAWFGAWPMPLDWERPWQEWPICVTYGAMIGYVLGMLASFLLVLHGSSRQQTKQD